MIDGHSYGCLMAVLPDDVAREITAWASRHIDPNHLGKGGLEDRPHVTIKYGFEGDDPEVAEALRKIMAAHGPIWVGLGNFSTFDDRGDGDVLFLKVDSPQLHVLNRFVSERFPCKDSFPTYTPHVTVAYLNPKFTDSYARLERLPFQRRAVLVTEAEYSDKENNSTRIPLTVLPPVGGKAMSWLAEGSGGALVKPPRTWRAIGGRLLRPRVRIKSLEEEDGLGSLDQRISLITDIVGGLMDVGSLKTLATKYYGGTGQKAWGDYEVKEIVEKKDRRGRRYCTEKGRGWRRVKCPGAPQVKPSRIRKAGQGEGGGGAKKPAGGGRRAVREEDKPAPKGFRPQVGAVYDWITEIQDSGVVTPKTFQDVLNTLMQMTVKDLTELKKQLGLKASGDKRAFAHKIVTRAFADLAQKEKTPEKRTGEGASPKLGPQLTEKERQNQPAPPQTAGRIDVNDQESLVRGLSAAGRSIPDAITGRLMEPKQPIYESHKVLISDLYEALRPRLGGVSLNDFKKAVFAAHMARRLDLSRMDMVQAVIDSPSGSGFDRTYRSEIAVGNATFHTVNINDPRLRGAAGSDTPPPEKVENVRGRGTVDRQKSPPVRRVGRVPEET